MSRIRATAASVRAPQSLRAAVAQEQLAGGPPPRRRSRPLRGRGCRGSAGCSRVAVVLVAGPDGDPGRLGRRRGAGRAARPRPTGRPRARRDGRVRALGRRRERSRTTRTGRAGARSARGPTRSRAAPRSPSSTRRGAKRVGYTIVDGAPAERPGGREARHLRRPRRLGPASRRRALHHLAARRAHLRAGDARDRARAAARVRRRAAERSRATPGRCPRRARCCRGRSARRRARSSGPLRPAAGSGALELAEHDPEEQVPPRRLGERRQVAAELRQLVACGVERSVSATPGHSTMFSTSAAVGPLRPRGQRHARRDVRVDGAEERAVGDVHRGADERPARPARDGLAEQLGVVVGTPKRRMSSGCCAAQTPAAIAPARAPRSVRVRSKAMSGDPTPRRV